MYADIPLTSIVVQKYGGTSVGNPERIKAVAERVRRTVDRGFNRQAIVVSAMAGETNKLVALVNQVNPNASANAYDMAVAAGEQVSVALLAAALQKVGLKARPLLAYQLGVFTDHHHSRARIRNIQTEKLFQAWDHQHIPIVAGFQGVTDDLELTTLGRGGSDTSAVALAVALKASFCEINTDVDGVFTADPRTVPQAKLIEKMDFEVALEMASLGSKVLHPRCVELGAKYRMPITVRNSFKDDDSQRTLIMSFNDDAILEAPVVSGVTLDRNIARVNVRGLQQQPNLRFQLFDVIAKRGVNVDIIVHDQGEASQDSLGFTVSSADLPTVLSELKSLVQGSDQAPIQVEDHLSKVSVVGLGMRSHPGVASKTFSALTQAGIGIKMISTSEIKISCVIPNSDGDEAVRVLHRAFIET